ncbi:MAG: hypothetical protein ACHREM_20585 [Polyangiales bacterium]
MRSKALSFAPIGALLAACSTAPSHAPPAPGSDAAADLGVADSTTLDVVVDLGSGLDAEAGTDSSPLDASTETFADAARDAAPDATTTFAVTATTGTLVVDSAAVVITGHGAADVGAIAITQGSGTVVLDAATASRPATRAFVMAHQVFPGEDLFQTVAVDADRVTVLWLYCSAGVLNDIFLEDSRGGPMREETPSGTCTFTSGSASVSVDVPAFTFVAPPPPSGWTFAASDKTQLDFEGTSPGTIVVAGKSLALYPFDTVDCSTCGSGGWQEIHSFFWDQTARALTFGILYLFPPAVARPTQLSYSLTLPTLAQPPDQTFDGTWSHTP